MSVVVLTDFAWADDRIERDVIETAGHRLISGPSTAGTGTQIVSLIQQHTPDAIMSCWAPVSSDAIAAAPNLRIVARLGVGLDNIALDDAAKAGVWVTNVPDYCVEEVSDHALALVLAWSRGVVALDRNVKGGVWNPAGARLLRLNTLTVGIVGFGRIGQITARKLRGLGVRVIAVKTVALASEGVQFMALEGLLSQADVVIMHLPLRPSTEHLADGDFFRRMKSGAFFVNVSRGPIVDNAALLAALNAGHLSGAGLDVIEGEPNPPADLVGRPDVIVTPHVAFSSTTSVVELRRRGAAEVVRVLAGRKPQFPCNQPHRNENTDA